MQNYRKRWQDSIIAEHIKKNSHVLDLGCGEGDLLYRLINDKNVFGQGVEIDSSCVHKCVDKCVPVMQVSIEDGLSFYNDQSFDYVILEETLQTMSDPIVGLIEMLRIGKYGIVSFPNFAYKNVSKYLIEEEKMPVTEWLPYQWHNTPNIHLCTLRDVEGWIDANGAKIKAGYGFTEGEVAELDENSYSNAEEILLIIES